MGYVCCYCRRLQYCMWVISLGWGGLRRALDLCKSARNDGATVSVRLSRHWSHRRHVAVPGLRICLASDWPGFDALAAALEREPCRHRQHQRYLRCLGSINNYNGSCHHISSQNQVMLGQSGIAMSVHLALLAVPPAKGVITSWTLIGEKTQSTAGTSLKQAPDLQWRPMRGRTLCRTR